MPSSHHSYIEITALDAIRARFAAGDAMVVLTPALDQVIWANGAGAALLGYADAAAIIGAQPQLGLAAKRQVMATSGYPRIGKDRAITVRLASGLTSRAVSFAASEIALPGGVDAILLAAAAPAASWRNPAETAARAIAGLDRAGEHVAIVDAAGKPVATSRKFDALGIGSEVLALLIAETRSERLMKRPIETARGPRAAGFLRLSDDPAMHLLVVADEALPAAEPVAVSTDAAELAVPAAMDESPAPAAAAAAEVGEADAEQPSVDSGQTMPGQASEADPARQVAELQAPADVTSQEALDQAAARTNGVGQEQPAEAREEQPPTAEERQPPADTPLPASAEPQLGWEAAAPQPAEAAVAEAPAEIATVGAGAADLPGDRATEAETPVAEAAQPAEAAGEQVASNASEDVQRSVASDQESAQPVAEPEAGPLPEEPTEPVAASEAEREAVESATADEPEGEEAQASTNVAVGDATDGTSAEDSPMDAGPVASAASDLASSEPVAASIPPIEVDRSAAPVRFVWKTDAAGRFSEIGSEFVTAVGGPAANVMGLSFREAAARLGIDPSGEIAGLLERHDTWSGRAVFWPVAGTDLRIPVDLAALPTYDRDRKFAGFRGFGVARAADAVVDPEATGLALLGNQPAPATVEEPAVTGEPTPTSPGAEQSASGGVPAAVADPFQGEPRILTIVPKPDRRQADKVIRLAEHRQPTIDKNLSPGERNAFREIGDRLRKDNGAPVARTPAEPTLRADNDRASPAEKTSSQPPARGGGSPDADSEEPRPASPPDTGDFQREDAAALEAVFADPMLAGGETSEGEAVAEQGDVAPAAPTEIPADDVSAGTAFAEPASGGETAPADARRDATVEADAGGHDAAAGVGEAAKPDAAPAGTTATDDGAQASVTVQEDGVGLASEQSPEEAAATLEPEAGAAEVQSQGANPQLAADIAEAAPIEAGEAADAMVARADEPQPVAEQAPPAEAAAPQQDFLPSAFAFDAPSSGRVAVDTSILEKLPVPVLIHAGDELHYANREFFELTGFNSVAELQAAGGLDALFGDPYPAEEGDDEHGRKLRLRTSEGLEYPVEAFLQSVPWGEGKSLLLSLRRSWRQPVSYPVAAPVMATDPDLEARIAEMRAIVDTATDGVVLIAPDGTIRSISSPAEALFAFDSAEVAGKPFTSLFAIESQRAARDYLNGLSDNGVASVLNDGREVIGREAQGRFIPLFMTIGKLPNDSGFCAVVRDITQWKRAEEELTQARAQAERASSQKTDFLARVSHEIRTPLNAIIGFSELMLDEKFGPVGNDRYRDYLRDINRSGSHVLDLVNDLLDISKIEAGQQEMSYEAVSLNDTLGETVAMMQPAANRERVIIRSSFASRLPEVVADLRSVRQIALNLLSNAIRYTPAGGQVIVSTAYESSGDVVMRVRDTGIGMSQAEIEQALKPFKQINALKRARGDGTGLGLPLTKAMVEANRARFTINSTPGEGTLVEVSFPSTRVLAD